MNKKDVNTTIQTITQKIVKQFHPDKIILFGSYAWGKPDTDSDVDLFIVKETENTRELAWKLMVSFSHGYSLSM